MSAPPICGVWVDGDGKVWTSRGQGRGERIESAEIGRWFAWLQHPPETVLAASVSLSKLAGEGAFTCLAETDSLGDYYASLKQLRGSIGVDSVTPLESQYLLRTRQRLFAEVKFSELRRCQLDIETASSDGEFSDPTKPDDRVLAIGLNFGERERTLVIAEISDDGEKALLEQLNAILAEEDPDTLEGHNIYKFDLDFLRKRAKRLRVPCAWGRFGQPAKFRNSRLKVAERWIDFPRCDLPGRTVVDTFLLVQLYDITRSEHFLSPSKKLRFGAPPERSIYSFWSIIITPARQLPRRRWSVPLREATPGVSKRACFGTSYTLMWRHFTRAYCSI